MDLNMTKKVKHNILFKLGFSSAFIGTLCNAIPVAATVADINYSEKKLNSYLQLLKQPSNFEKQQAVLSEVSALCENKTGYIKNFNELKTLDQNQICVDESSLNELSSTRTLQDLYSKNLVVNLFDENNLDNSLKSVLKIILSNDITGTSFSDKFDEINANKAIKEKLTTLLNYLNITEDTSNDKQVFILKSLNEIAFLMKSNNTSENSIDIYFSSMKKAYQVLISRRVNETALKKEREKAMNFLQQASKTRTAGTTVNAGYSGATIGISANVHHDEGKSEKSFYEISIGGGLSLSLGCEFGVGLGDVKTAIGVNGSVSGDISVSTIFFSLEQFLDAQLDPSIKNKSASYLSSSTLKKLVSDRKSLVDTEKDLLACFQNGIEFYLKAAKIIPIAVHLTWPTLTKASTPVNESRKTLSGNIEAIAELLNSSLAGTVTISGKKINQKVTNSFLKTINDDCSANLGLTADEIQKEFASNKSLYHKVKTEFEKTLLEDTHKENGLKILPVLMPQLLADIRQYNTVLSVLADKTVDGENHDKAKESKHNIEERWLGKSLIKTRRREKMLKTAITLSAYLRQFAETDEEIALFKQMYNELVHLLELQNFSKNKKTPNSGFKSEKSYNEYSISGNTKVNVFDVANASINVKYVKTENEPGYGDGEDIIISVNLPFIDSLLSGVETVKEMLQKMHKETPKNEFNLEESFISVSKTLDTVVGFTGFPKRLKVPGASATTNGCLNLTFELAKINKSSSADAIIPIESQNKMINEKNSWVLKCIKVSAPSSLNTNISGGANAGAVKLSGKASLSTEYVKSKKFKLGDKCLVFPISRFNVASTCSKDTKAAPNEDYIWVSFKASNKNELCKMLKNIADTNSIAYYQVQSMYNDLLCELESSGEQSVKEHCKEVFKQFIESCKTLNKSQNLNEAAYNKALSLFEEILALNFEHNFTKKLNRNWALDSKTQNLTINF